jgi:hypothetical protein
MPFWRDFEHAISCENCSPQTKCTSGMISRMRYHANRMTIVGLWTKYDSREVYSILSECSNNVFMGKLDFTTNPSSNCYLLHEKYILRVDHVRDFTKIPFWRDFAHAISCEICVPQTKFTSGIISRMQYRANRAKLFRFMDEIRFARSVCNTLGMFQHVHRFQVVRNPRRSRF